MSSSCPYKSSVIRGLCRTCMAKEIKLLSVFELRFGKITFDRVISSITGIKIKQDDRLPTTICKDCEEKAAKAYDFKINALQSQDKLFKILQETQEISNEEDFIIEIDQMNVKMEKVLECDDNDDLDLDPSLTFDDAEDSFEVDNMIKNETDVQCEMDNSKENLKAEVLFEDETEKNSSYCPVCCQNFPDGAALTEHAWQNHADVMGPRKRGRKKKLTTTILHKMTKYGHESKQASDSQYRCLFCYSSFKTKDILNLHTSEHKDEKLYSCMLCKKIYWKKKDFERHTCTKQLDLNKKGEALLGTEPEDKHELYTEVRLQDLLRKNVGEDQQLGVSICDCCGGLFVSEDDLEKHRDRDHPEISVRCQICDKVFASLKSAARHRAACERVERQFACPTCGLRFSHEVTLNKHILSTHTGQSVSLRFLERSRDRSSQSFKCETCSRPFTRKDLLDRHMRSHNTGDKVFECEICKKKFTRRDNLRSHMRTHEGKKYTVGAGSLCLYCGRSFSNSSNYIVHMRRHTGEKPYKCDFCGKGFCRSSDLQCHRRSHTGEKPCVCRVCGKAFSRSNKLTRHMRVHTGDKPYKCTYCEKAFAQSNDLTVHVRRHTGDKPYVCELCGDRFIQGTALHAHRRSHGHYPLSAAPQPPPLGYTLQNPAQAHCPTQN